jgi:hypothetical protein
MERALPSKRSPLVCRRRAAPACRCNLPRKARRHPGRAGKPNEMSNPDKADANLVHHRYGAVARPLPRCAENLTRPRHTAHSRVRRGAAHDADVRRNGNGRRRSGGRDGSHFLRVHEVHETAQLHDAGARWPRGSVERDCANRITRRPAIRATNTPRSVRSERTCPRRGSRNRTRRCSLPGVACGSLSAAAPFPAADSSG